MNRRHKSRPAFTLIELLVVVAIIALVAVLLVAGVRAGLDRSRQAACLSNQRQIFTAMLLYAAENRDSLPWAVTQEADKAYLANEPKPWLQDVLLPYAGGATGNLSRVFRCPGVKQTWLRENPNANHYRYNAPNAGNANLGSIQHPFQAVVLFDTAWPDWSRRDLPHDGVILQYADGHGAHLDASSFLDPAAFDGDLLSPLMTDGWR